MSLYSESFWSVFSHIDTEYGEIFRIAPHSVRIRENTDHFLHSIIRLDKSYCSISSINGVEVA